MRQKKNRDNYKKTEIAFSRNGNIMNDLDNSQENAIRDLTL